MGIEVWTPALLSVTDVARKRLGTWRKLKLKNKKRWHNITAKYKSDGDEPLHPAVPESLGLYYQ
jgi:hypothetical protein